MVLCSIGTGCGSKHASLADWRRSVMQRASNDGGGELSFLRDPVGRSERRRFDVIGTDSPDESTDVKGVLLGRREINGRPWLVFLVGSVKERRVEDIRVAMLSDDASKSKWMMSSADHEALDLYRQYKQKAWQALHPDRSEPPMRAMEFPAESDVYRLEQDDAGISIIEANSGARWTLKVPDRRDAEQATEHSPEEDQM